MQNPLPKAGQRVEAVKKIMSANKLAVYPGDQGTTVRMGELVEVAIGVKWDKHPNCVLNVWADNWQETLKIIY